MKWCIYLPIPAHFMTEFQGNILESDITPPIYYFMLVNANLSRLSVSSTSLFLYDITRIKPEGENLVLLIM